MDVTSSEAAYDMSSQFCLSTGQLQLMHTRDSVVSLSLDFCVLSPS